MNVRLTAAGSALVIAFRARYVHGVCETCGMHAICLRGMPMPSFHRGIGLVTCFGELRAKQ